MGKVELGNEKKGTNDMDINVSDVEQLMTCRGPCKKKTYPRKVFLNHIMHAKDCKSLYSNEEVSEMKVQNREFTKGKWKRKQNNQGKTLIQCKGVCNRKFKRKSLLNHIKQAKKCKAMYEDEDIRSMESESWKIHQDQKKARYASMRNRGTQFQYIHAL